MLVFFVRLHSFLYCLDNNFNIIEYTSLLYTHICDSNNVEMKSSFVCAYGNIPFV